MGLYRVNVNQFPLPPNKVAVSSLKHPTVETSEGRYTWSLSAAVSTKKTLEPGTYILVPTTFDPMVFASFSINLYTSTRVMAVAPYQHSS